MEKYNRVWRLFYGIAIIGIAIQQMVICHFMPVIVPPGTPLLSNCKACVFIVSILLLIGGICIAFTKKSRTKALLTGVLLLLLFVVFHLPYQLQNNMHFLAGWSDALKILALSGGAFVVAGSLTNEGIPNKLTSILEKLIPLGRFFFAIDILMAGIMHFMYMPFVVMLVPAWIPWPTFWGYLAGIALIAASLGIILNIQLKLAANLLGGIILIWLITLHIPRAIADSVTGNGNEIVSVFEALGFSGIAFLIGASARSPKE
jgi:uncharacterized membrane protein